MTTGTVEVLSYLQKALASGQTSGVITKNADGTYAMSIDIGPGASFLTLSPIQGPQGISGVNQFPLMLMPDTYDSPADLPAPGTLTDTEADIGKFWMIDILNEEGQCTSTAAYIWFGTEFRFLPFGSQGPPGPYPVIVPYINLLGPNMASQPVVTGTGIADDPFLWTLDLSVPEGPVGPSCPLAEMEDVDESVPPITGQFLAATAATVDVGDTDLTVWAPQSVGEFVPLCYTVPRAAFIATSGITFDSSVTIASFTVPANPWPWKPICFGQVLMWELELSFAPLTIGIEVRLNSPTGTLVARGFGNTLSGVVTIFPHTSAPGSPTVAMTPGNGVGLVAANTAATLYVTLVNDGLIGIYDYNSGDAELFVMACPSTQPIALKRGIFGALSTKVTLTGWPNISEHVFTHGQGVLTPGTVESWPVTQEFTTSGTYTPPSWWISGTHYLDLIAVGDGGGGSTANDFDYGGPGGAGAWNTTTIQTLSSGHLTVTIGEGGRGARTDVSGTAGSGVTLKDGSTSKLSAAGGAGGTYTGGGSLGGTGWVGPSPGPKTYESQTYSGPNDAGYGGSGATRVFTAGSRGMPGAAWIVARKT